MNFIGRTEYFLFQKSNTGRFSLTNVYFIRAHLIITIYLCVSITYGFIIKCVNTTLELCSGFHYGPSVSIMYSFSLFMESNALTLACDIPIH